MNILVTGGCGYIGSHTVLELINSGYGVIVLDNLYNSSEKVLPILSKLSGQEIPFVNCDIRDRTVLERVFSDNKIDAVIHFAGLKAVGESCEKPLLYYDNNVAGTVTLCEIMKKYGCRKLIFSSSATVYGTGTPPFNESMPVGEGITNPYGRTKFMIEEILRDLYKSDPSWSICLLRYFNPVGAHESGLIGEAPDGIPNNLMPYITQVAVGKRERLSVFGNDYDTPDGTGVRDYIHVCDLACGHVKSLDKIKGTTGLFTYNLGTGTGYSVLDIINAFEKASGRKIPYVITDRRDGDIAVCYSDSSKAERELGFKAERGIFEMCRDSWNWQSKNPNGYNDK